MDINYCYAQIAIRQNPALAGRPLAVCGDPERRHGIVLTATPEAKRMGVRTGDVLHDALSKCSNLMLIPADRREIRRYTNQVLQICSDYTDRISRMGDDEAYMDVTHTLHLFGGDALALADTIRLRIWEEVGLTVSIGVSFSKVYAKLGSDYKKPFACTLIDQNNYKDIVWPLPVSDLFWVGRATTQKLQAMGLYSIGMLARSDRKQMEKRFGVIGARLWDSANGICNEEIPFLWECDPAKTIGNSMTAIHDLRTEQDIRLLTKVLSESVAERLREDGSKCLLLMVGLRSTDLSSFQRQKRLPFPTCTAKTIGEMAYRMILDHWDGKPLRGLEVRACNLIEDDYQMSILPEVIEDQKQETKERAQQDLRRRFGHFILFPGIALVDKPLTNIDIRDKLSAHSSAFKRKI